MQIAGAVALVTGANRGIGKAFTAELLARGVSKVYAGVRDVSTVDVTDSRVVPVTLDVTDPGRIESAARELSDVTLLVNNAGIGAFSTPLTAPIDQARREIETNYLAVVGLTQAFAPVLAANGGGAVVQMLSVVSWAAPPGLSTYAASKAAAWAWTNAARIELRQQKTQVVGVHVGFVDTDLVVAVEGEKVDPAVVATAAFDGLERGEVEVAVDDFSRMVKSGLSDDQNVIYPELERQFLAS